MVESPSDRFVPHGVTRFVHSTMEGGPRKVQKHVAILFVDIVGCTRLCERLPPATMNTLIERYFAAFFDVVEEQKGTVNEIMGDGFMAVFEAGPLEKNARQAVRAAASILKAAVRMNDADPQLDTQVQIGAHAGAAFVGITRFLTRRGERWTYTASGPVTNVAARLCALAGPGATAVSADVVKLVGGRFAFESLGVRELKNVRVAVEVHRLDRGNMPGG